jgi:hypothetical protein
MYLTLLLATLAVLPQDPPHEPTMLERIDALIAKSNSYAGFVAKYRGFDPEQREFTFRMAYRSPSDLELDMRCEGYRSVNRIRATAWDKLELKGDSDVEKASIEEWNAPARYLRRVRGLVEQEFPGAIRRDDLPDQMALVIMMRPSPDGAAIQWNFGGGTATSARLNWLEEVRGHPEAISAGRDREREIEFLPDGGVTMTISLETGFVTRLEKQTTQGPQLRLELVSLEIVPRPADSEFELPALGERVRDTSDDLGIATDDRGFLMVRVSLFSVLARAIDDGRLKWTEETPARVERVLLGLHQMHSARFMTGAVAIVQGLVDKKATSLRDWLKQVDLTDPKTLVAATEWVRRAREDMEKQLQTLRDEYAADEPAPGSCMQRLSGACKTRVSLYEDLATIEQRIQPMLYTEGVIKPALADFEEKVGKQLEAK